MPGYKVGGAVVVVYLVSIFPEVLIIADSVINFLPSSIETSKTHLKLSHCLSHVINTVNLLFFSYNISQVYTYLCSFPLPFSHP